MNNLQKYVEELICGQTLMWKVIIGMLIADLVILGLVLTCLSR